MNRKQCGLALVTLVLAVIFTVSAQPPGSARIEKISVEPNPLHPRVVLTSNDGLHVTSAAYAQDYPNTLILDIAGATLAQQPQPPGDVEPLVSALKVEPRENNSLRLLLSLKEKVPFRILAGPGQTVVELNRILEPGSSSVVDQAMEQALANRTRSRVTLQSVEVQDSTDRVNIGARCNPKVMYNIFALGNPLRLVVDLYDTVYHEPTSTYPIEKYGVDRLKVGQFKSEPDPVTRMVFDMKEPKLYSLVTGATGLTISFAKEQTEPAVGAISPEPAAAAAPAPSAPEVPPVESKPEKAAAAAPAPQPAAQPAQAPAAKPQEESTVKGMAVPADQFAPRTVEAAETKYTG
jgi:hypothetical protein